ncbi:hypothetical protein AArcSl_0301 [Halalkaliarchaeum desulfuricum]|uniref:Uncharacterized protein n=1 Tax=Halalkaliarchaeum desulfuricum TaxID=2055893 RepID=A0A343TFT4_9EURY|nr:hypothetical protein [Halalkaliarchaeum desulfuricum]AUX07956.1 hypothetical protein AArcSl_0301 [Halalkaliarchaeum desulfuricum]
MTDWKRTLRGQAHTLEAVTAALLVLSAVVFALQVTAVTPLTGSTSSQHIENQQTEVAEGLLAAEDRQGTISETLRYWNESNERFHGAQSDGYTSGGPPTAFGEALNETFLDRGIAFNVHVRYVRDDGSRGSEQVVDLGEPSDHATTATRLVSLYNSDPLIDADATENGTATVGDGVLYVEHDVSPETDLFSVVEVEVVVWRM